MAVVAGVDVAKASLDVSVSEGPVLRFDNNAKGITKLLRHLKRQEATLAVCESTGGHERLLASRLRKAEIGVRVANPSRVRAFARACGYEAKTDPLDAQVLSRFGQVFPESETPETEPEREELQDLLRRRRQLVEQRVQEVNRLDKGSSAGVAESTKRHIAWLEAEIAQLEKEYQEGLQSSARLAQRAALYRTVPGVGPLTAAILVAHLPELGHWDSKALTSLVGLAPWSRDSGRKRGQRAIRGGRGVDRKALYLCACSVIQIEGELRRFYQKPAPARETRQRGIGGRDPQAAVAAKRSGPPGNAMGAVGRIDGSFGNSPKDLTSDHGYCSGSSQEECGDPRCLTVFLDHEPVGLPHPAPPERKWVSPRYKNRLRDVAGQSVRL